MLKDVFDFITIFLAFAAFVISIVTAITNRKKLITSAISSNRIEWIKEVRALMFDFINEYKINTNKTRLHILASQIMLYLNRQNDYSEFVDAIRRCVDFEYSESNHLHLVNSTQDMLNSVWRRMKLETGLNTNYDHYIIAQLKKDKQKLHEAGEKFTNVI